MLFGASLLEDPCLSWYSYQLILVPKPLYSPPDSLLTTVLLSLSFPSSHHYSQHPSSSLQLCRMWSEHSRVLFKLLLETTITIILSFLGIDLRIDWTRLIEMTLGCSSAGCYSRFEIWAQVSAVQVLLWFVRLTHEYVFLPQICFEVSSETVMLRGALLKDFESH